MPSKNKLGIVIGTKLEAMWTNVKDAAIQRLQLAEDNVLIETELIKIAKNKILLEKRK